MAEKIYIAIFFFLFVYADEFAYSVTFKESLIVFNTIKFFMPLKIHSYLVTVQQVHRALFSSFCASAIGSDAIVSMAWLCLFVY